MGNVRMEARQINYRGGESITNVEEAIKNAGSTYVLPIAAADTLGGVKIGTGLEINAETGELSNSNPTPYELPIAAADTLGGVMVGTGLSIDAETGVLSSTITGVVDYTETEQDTGMKWIDGKTIYQRTFVLVENGVAQYTVANSLYDVGLTGCEYVFLSSVFAVRQDGIIYNDSMLNELNVLFDRPAGKIYVYEGRTFTDIVVTVQYTKATV